MMSKFNFIIILFIGFLNYLGIALVYPLFATMLFEPATLLIPADSSAAFRGTVLGILIGLTPMTQFFSAPILGALSDFKGRKKTILHGCWIGVLAYSLAVWGIYTQSLFLLFLYRILTGIAAGIVPVAQAMIADNSTPHNKAKRFSLFSASLGFGFTVGPFLGGKLANLSLENGWGYALPFIVAGILCTLNLWFVLWQFPNDQKIHRNTPFQLLKGLDNIRKVFRWHKLRWLFFTTFLFAFAWSFFNEFIPVLLREQFAFNLNDIGNYYAFGGAWYAFCSAITATMVLRYFSPETIGVKSLIGCAICMLAFLIIDERLYIWLTLPFLMFFLTFTYPIIGSIISNRIGTENQGEILGVYQSVIGFAMGISPLSVGSLIGMYPELTAIGGALVMFIASFAFWQGVRKQNA